LWGDYLADSILSKRHNLHGLLVLYIYIFFITKLTATTSTNQKIWIEMLFQEHILGKILEIFPLIIFSSFHLSGQIVTLWIHC